jgi:uncharacterized protein (TIGR00730 family)
MFKKICVFCGSNSGAQPAYEQAARELGELLASRNIGLVYGGGRVGLMGTVADTVLAAGGQVVGVIPQGLMRKEIAHAGLTELRVVASMHERKATMEQLSDAFIAMPGGFGTFEELCEIVTWAQLGLHQKPCGILNVNGYYDPLLELFDRAVREEFLHPMNRALAVAEEAPGNLLAQLESYQVPRVEKWLTPGSS